MSHFPRNPTEVTLDSSLRQIARLEAELSRLRSRITVGDVVTYQGAKYEVEDVKRWKSNGLIMARLVIGQDAPRDLMLYDGWAPVEDVTLAEKGDPNGLG
jgi:hypothetical protein